MAWFFGNRKSLVFALTLAFILALGIRFYDLTDLPLDFAPTRQLFSALKARGMYYENLPANTAMPAWQREMAVRQWKSIPAIEPPVLETLTALTYRVTGEHLWIARLYSSLFWVLAGILLFLLAQELSGPSGAFIALLFYLFLPYGIIASRTFQPDPLMVALIIAGLWASFRWANARTCKWAVTAGILCGLAIFVKNVAVFPLAFAAAGLVIDFGLTKSIKDKQTWLFAGLAALPAAAYSLYGVLVAGFLGGQFAFRFFPQLWATAAFYLRWKGQIDGVIGFGAFAAGAAGLFVTRRRSMALLLGLWAGYLAYGMTFAYHITSHDYYQILLIPIVALSLAPLAQTLFDQAVPAAVNAGRSLGWTRTALAGLLILVTAIQLWNVRVELIRDDWRSDADFWAALGDKLGHNPILASGLARAPVLTIAQDYGYRLAYWGWQEVDAWYDSGDLDLRVLDGRQIDLQQRFEEQTTGKQFFVVTQFAKLDQQPEIKTTLYKTYPIFSEGPGYIIFDLTDTLEQK